MTPEQRRVLTALRKKPEYSYGTPTHWQLLEQGLICADLNLLNCVVWKLSASGRRALAEAEGEE